MLLRISRVATHALRHTKGFATLRNIPIMTTPRSQMSHEERTASEPRDSGFHRAILSHIEPINKSIRLLRLNVFDRQRSVKV